MRRYGFLAVALFVMTAHAGATSPSRPGIQFQHGDWEIACDNTGTCRAAGYQTDEDAHAVSVLLTRKAGPGTTVAGQLMLGQYGDDDVAMLERLPDPAILQMRIDGKALGTVSVSHETAIGQLSAEQVAALIASLSRQSRIEFLAGGDSWHLSGEGASAVLLKMDDAQGRIGTRGALVRKGPHDEQQVPAAQPMPLVHAAKVLDHATTPSPVLQRQAATLQKQLAATASADDCANLFEARPDELSFEAARLDDGHWLVSVMCWQAAYNEGYAYWVIHAQPPFAPVLVTTDGSGYADGGIASSQKGRGLGDCLSSERWTWDGRQFVQTALSGSGMCKLMAPGGAWELPTLVTGIR